MFRVFCFQCFELLRGTSICVGHDGLTDHTIHNQAVNVGANDQNFQVRDVADEVQKLIPEAGITYTGEVGSDPRDYRVNFDLLYSLLPGFRLQYTLSSGMEELHRKMVEHGFDAADFEGDQFVRLRTLNKRMDLLRSHKSTPLLDRDPEKENVE